MLWFVKPAKLHSTRTTRAGLTGRFVCERGHAMRPRRPAQIFLAARHAGLTMLCLTLSIGSGARHAKRCSALFILLSTRSLLSHREHRKCSCCTRIENAARDGPCAHGKVVGLQPTVIASRASPPLLEQSSFEEFVDAARASPVKW